MVRIIFLIFLFISVAKYIIPTISVFSHLGFFSRFLADDYCVAAVARDFTFINSLIYWYLNWHGGYSVVLVDEVLPYIAPDKIPFVVPLLLWTWILAAIATFYVILPESLHRIFRFLLSAALGPIFVFTLLLINPDIPQSVFWWSGMRAYNLPVLLATLYIFLFFLFKKIKKYRFLAALLGFLMTFFMAGFSEIFSAVQIVFFAGLLSLEFYLGNKTRKIFSIHPSLFMIIGSLAGAIIGGFAMVLAPGNYVRQSHFAQPLGIIETLQISFSGFSSFMLEIVQNETQIWGLAGAFLIFFCSGIISGNQQQLPGWLSPIFFLAGFIFVFGCFIPASYATSAPTPYRSLSIATYFLLCFTLTAGFLAGLTIRNYIYNPKNLTATVTVAAVIGIFLTSTTANQTQQTWFAKEHEYVLFADKWDRVHRFVVREKNKGEADVIIPPMKNWALLGDPGQDNSYWINQCYSDYYGIKIRTEKKIPE